MTRFTVVWHTLAQDELADLWLTATDRAALTRDAIAQTNNEPPNTVNTGTPFTCLRD
jgi:hypothetical protein